MFVGERVEGRQANYRSLSLALHYFSGPDRTPNSSLRLPAREREGRSNENEVQDVAGKAVIADKQ